jgi:diacylglycerol kinase family enzyme
MASKQSPQQFEHIFVLFNPASTHATRSRRRIAELKKLFPKTVEVIETSSEGREANQEIIRKLAPRLTGKTLLAIASGDGTVGLIVETLTATGKNSLPKAASQAPILPLWGGNANDLAYMLNGISLGKRLAAVFKKADVVPIYPIMCTISADGSASNHIAACYVAFGVSGRMAHTLNKRSYRSQSGWKNLGLKVFRELSYVTQTFRLATKFSYSQSGKQHHVYELLFANGSRMAKVDRLPISLAEPYFYADQLEHSTLGAVMRKLLNISRGKRRERRLHKRLHLTIHNEVWVQFDGEPELVPAGSEVSISLHDRPFYALASSLRQPRSARRPSRLRIFASKYRRVIKQLNARGHE